MKLHHIGIVVKDLRKSLKEYQEVLNLKQIGVPHHEKRQKVIAGFLSWGSLEGTTLELLEPVGEDSPVYKFMKKDGGIHHICFEVDDIEKEVDELREKGGKVVCEPVSCTGFEGRRIAFILTLENLLIEFVEKEKKLEER
ncbi:MAG TPA: methylmalonyl-CoA epimerase [Candidatus Atribacteria bacterium]|nr:VOC family protein [Deltaproteobacteria bacterium]RLB34291.1 MAG: methylmalonyl-CoA epimerase [Deltaproteobacteria bacterium]HEC92352.1 methylmalonyl-CoA epimerase [Candidatus Atribacteria bacterium]